MRPKHRITRNIEIEIAGKTIEIADEMISEYNVAPLGHRLVIYDDGCYDVLGSDEYNADGAIYTLIRFDSVQYSAENIRNMIISDINDPTILSDEGYAGLVKRA